MWRCVRQPQDLLLHTLHQWGEQALHICSGNSGPLVVSSALISVTSFRAAVGCEWGRPGGFARVTYFNSWIRARM
ncbi:unnamed protein product [Leptosia nina]|uniref:Peptidase S1 domain-containing protein n=1 Tax=Leptosia nina TaxID=320188 RepID=A0AAV1JWL7_9NEOP